MSNGNNAGRNNNQQSQEKKVEKPAEAVDRLTKEIIDECKLIATGLSESCYKLVEKTKELMTAEGKL